MAVDVLEVVELLDFMVVALLDMVDSVRPLRRETSLLAREQYSDLFGRRHGLCLILRSRRLRDLRIEELD